VFRVPAVALVILATASGAAPESQAQRSSTAIPVFHGDLFLARGAGRIDAASGAATFSVRHWRVELADGSNGIFPTEEPVVVAFGEDRFRLEAGALEADRKGTRFRFRAAKDANPRGIVAMTIRRLSATAYDVSFRVADVQLFPLTQNAPICMPSAVIVGDDDGFTGVAFDRPGFPERRTRRLTVLRKRCTATAWPWT
jgi:hypothetical protein